MSYILDALKKSEQERGHGSAPTVQSTHSSGLHYHSNKTQLWPYILLAAVFINLAALLYFIIAKPDAETPALTQQETIEAQPVTNKPVSSVAQEASSPEVIVYKPVSMPAAAPKAVKPIPQVAEIETPLSQESSASVLEMDELPFNVLQHIPVLEFSAHVYSSNPVQRSIVINGRFMEEGDRLASDLILSEITPDGAIFDYQGQLFHKSVVSAWN